MNGTQARTRYTLPTAKVCASPTLVNLFFITPLVISISTTSSMFLIHKRICYPFINLHQIMMFFLEFHPSFFCVKDLATKKLLLQGRCRDGLYPLPPISQVHHVSTPTASRWHYRLGHPSSTIVDRVIKDNKLSFRRESHDSICDACQRG